MSLIRIIIGVGAVAVIGAIAFFMFGSGGGSDDLEINFNNNAYETITKWEISPAGQGNYVELALIDGAMEPVENTLLTIQGGALVCHYDMRITKDDGSVWEHMNRNLCDATYYHYIDEYPITFVNGSGQALNFVAVDIFSGNTRAGTVGFNLPMDGLAEGAEHIEAISQIATHCENNLTHAIRMGAGGEEMYMGPVDLCGALESGATITLNVN